MILSQTKEYLELADNLYSAYTRLLETEPSVSEITAPSSTSHLPFVIKRYEGDDTFSSFMHSARVDNDGFIITGPFVYLFIVVSLIDINFLAKLGKRFTIKRKGFWKARLLRSWNGTSSCSRLYLLPFQKDYLYNFQRKGGSRGCEESKCLWRAVRFGFLFRLYRGNLWLVR